MKTEVKAAQVGFKMTVDSDGFPVPGGLPEGILNDVEVPEDGVMPFEDGGVPGLSAEFAAPITVIGGNTAPLNAQPPPGGIFNASIFGAPPALGQPVIDATVPAPDPIDVGEEPFEEVDLGSSIGCPPLIQPSKNGQDVSSTPRYMRDFPPDKALCKGCTRSVRLLNSEPAKSQTWSPIRLVVLCTAFDPKSPRDVTNTPILFCDLYEPDAKKLAEKRTYIQMADDVRQTHGVALPPRGQSTT